MDDHSELEEQLRSVCAPAAGADDFTVTVCFPRSDHPGFDAAWALARCSPAYREHGTGGAWRACATFTRRQAEDLHRLYERARGLPGVRLAIGHRPLPLLHELWLPLMWFYRVR